MGLHAYFSKNEQSGKLDGFYSKTGVVGMLEASYYEAVDMVLLFLDTI